VVVTFKEAVAWCVKKQLMCWDMEVEVSACLPLATAIADITEQVSKVIYIDKMHEQKGKDNATQNGVLPQGQISRDEHV